MQLQRYAALFARATGRAEFEASSALPLAFGALILGYFVAFMGWFYRTETTVDGIRLATHICWSYFQGCRDLVVFQTLPFGYSQPMVYMALFGFLILSVYFLLQRRFGAAQLALLPAVFWHAFVAFVLTNSLTGNYDYYLVLFSLILFLIPHKEFFLRLTLVLFYFLSTYSKMYPTWTLGAYFSALQTGLPIFPDATIPLWTNLVIGMELIGAWFLFSGRPWLQRSVLAFFITFHLYSGILVGYRYPATVLPMLIIMFGPLYKHAAPPLDRRSIAGWVLVGAIVLVQILGPLIPGDEKLTLEGNRYGLYMFEANHQCVSEARVVYGDGEERVLRAESNDAPKRCDPYDYWFNLKAVCERESGVARIEWTFDHSVNGGPFLRIVDVPDACALSYRPFSHNAWIRATAGDAERVGYPVKNIYR